MVFSLGSGRKIKTAWRGLRSLRHQFEYDTFDLETLKDKTSFKLETVVPSEEFSGRSVRCVIQPFTGVNNAIPPLCRWPKSKLLIDFEGSEYAYVL